MSFTGGAPPSLPRLLSMLPGTVGLARRSSSCTIEISRRCAYARREPCALASLGFCRRAGSLLEGILPLPRISPPRSASIQRYGLASLYGWGAGAWIDARLTRGVAATFSPR